MSGKLFYNKEWNGVNTQMFHGALYTVIWNYIGFECKFKTIGGQLCFTH